MFKAIFLRRLSEWPLPAVLLTAALASAFNRYLRAQGSMQRLAELEGKRIGIQVRELPWAFAVTVAKDGLRVTARGESAHVTIRGSLADLRRLAMRQEDPDTLFFERRLCIEGETETGLLLKNLLDTLEWDWRAQLRSLLPPHPRDTM